MSDLRFEHHFKVLDSEKKKIGSKGYRRIFFEGKGDF